MKNKRKLRESICISALSVFHLNFKEKVWCYFPVSNHEELRLIQNSGGKMNSSLGYSVTFSRHSKNIWNPSLEHYAFPALVFVVGILGLLFLYVCFWKWVAKVIIKFVPMKVYLEFPGKPWFAYIWWWKSTYFHLFSCEKWLV